MEHAQTINQRVSFRDLYSVIIGLLPVIMIYNIPVINKGASTILLGLLLPYAILKFPFNKTSVKVIIPFFAFIIYIIARSTGDYQNMFLVFVAAVHIVGAVGGSINVPLMRKTIEITAVIASILVFIQTIIYYALGISLSLLIQPLLLNDLQYYINKIAGSLYRPSAFFLEPSHFTQYATIALASVLFPADKSKPNLKRAILIAAGCLCTTSGMGVALCLGVFLYYTLNYACKLKPSNGIFFIVVVLMLSVGIFFALMQLEMFQLTLQRVFGNVEGYNAIWGRTLFWNGTVGTLKDMQLIVGVGSVNTTDKYMTGLMEIIYYYGYLGIGLLVITLIAFFLYAKKNHFSRCVCIAYLGLLWAGNLFGFIIMTFWMCNMISERERPILITQKKCRYIRY